jgi:hypothetical protein
VLNTKPHTAPRQHQAVYSQGGLDARHLGGFVHQKDTADFSHAQFDEVAMEWPMGSMDRAARGLRSFLPVRGIEQDAPRC